MRCRAPFTANILGESPSRLLREGHPDDPGLIVRVDGSLNRRWNRDNPALPPAKWGSYGRPRPASVSHGLS